MTQKQIEQTRAIAEKDGWKDTGKPKRKGSEETGGEWYAKGSVGCWLDAMPYLTDLNSLHRVAMDVVEELSRIEMQTEKDYTNQPMFINGVLNEAALKARKLTRIENTITHIFLSFRSRPINGQYIDLFNAVYDAIVFLNQSKTTPQERG